MQEPKEQRNAEEKPRKKIINLIWGAIFGMMLLGLAGAFVYIYRNVPTSEWRQSSSPTPWRGAGVIVNEAEASWRNSAGDARMELRAAYYPVMRLQLDTCEGRGTIIVRFADETGAQRGESISIAYANGAFTPSRDRNVVAEGNKAEVHIESGFPTADEYLVHKFTESAPLWRVVVTNRPAGTYEEHFIGYTCVLPKE